jgi:hypothetical protein
MQLLGLHSSTVVEQVVASNPAVAMIAIKAFLPPPPFETRFEPTQDEWNLIERARALRHGLSVPFPDAVGMCVASGAAPSADFFRAMAYHHETGDPMWIPRQHVGEGALRSLPENVDHFIAVTSLVQQQTASGLEMRHIPMLDFRIRPRHGAVEVVTGVLNSISAPLGWILESGASYHYIGAEPISADDAGRLLASALLLSPITDRNWIAHQLIAGHATLRLTVNPQTAAPPPVVVATFRPTTHGDRDRSRRVRRGH